MKFPGREVLDWINWDMIDIVLVTGVNEGNRWDREKERKRDRGKGI